MHTAAAQKNRDLLKIGQVARELDIAVETIRMYETAGLIVPQKTASGQRLFDADDVHWLNCIRRLIKEQGMNLEGIRRLLALMPCWSIKPCTLRDQKICPATSKAEQPCWTMKDKLPDICKNADCRQCAVYQSASECTNLKTLLYRFKTEESNDHEKFADSRRRYRRNDYGQPAGANSE